MDAFSRAVDVIQVSYRDLGHWLGFSRQLWIDLFDDFVPAVLVGNGRNTARQFLAPLEAHGYSETRRDAFRTGWGDQTYEVVHLRHPHMERVTMFGIPHLSRFDLQGATVRADLVRRVAKYAR